MHTYYKRPVLFFMLLICISVFSQRTSSKTIKETYKLTNAGELYLENQYGNITINGWNKDEIEINIDIEVIDNKNKDAESILNRINPRYRAANNYVNVVSEITEKSTSLFAKYFKKVNPFNLEKSNISITYSINLPLNADVEIVNKFGDLIINDWTGKLDATLKHGDIFINETINSAEIDLKYGKIKAKSMNNGTINLKNGDIELDDIKYLNLNTSGSIIHINKVDDLELFSNKDKAEFNSIKSIEGEIKFSSIIIKDLENKTDLTTKVTDLEILNISKPNPSIEINQTSSDINININDTSFVFEATLEQGTLKLPKSFKNIKTRIIDEGKKIREIEATYGKTKSGSFSLTGKKGIITLSE